MLFSSLKIAFSFSQKSSLLIFCMCLCWDSILSWFEFYFPLFQTHYQTLPYPKTRKMKFKPRIKLNHSLNYSLQSLQIRLVYSGNLSLVTLKKNVNNISFESCHFLFSVGFTGFVTFHASFTRAYKPSLFGISKIHHIWPGENRAWRRSSAFAPYQSKATRSCYFEGNIHNLIWQ